MISNPLEGCIVEWPTKYPGLGELVSTPPDFDLSTIASIPGVSQPRPDPKTGKAKIYVPWNLWRMGQRPAGLKQLKEDPYETAPSGLKLTWYQRRGVTFLRSLTKMDGGAILAFDPGLAKTVTALQAAWLQGLLHKRVLIVGPLPAFDTWCSEKGDPMVHYNLKVHHINTTSVDPGLLSRGNCFFIHHDVFRPWGSFLFAWRPSLVIIDESHLLMNPDSQRTKDLMGLVGAGFIESRYLLTGTPIPKTRMDLGAQMAIGQPNQWGRGKVPFGQRYAGGRQVQHSEDKFHWVFDGQTNTEELRARLCGGYLRVTKAQVPGVLPSLRREAIDIRLSDDDRETYSQARRDIKAYKEQQGKADLETVTIGGEQIEVPEKKANALQLVVTGALKSILDRAKLPHALASVLEKAGKHPHLVVFTWKIDSAKWLYDQLSMLAFSEVKAGRRAPAIFGPIDGSIPAETRVMVAHSFIESPWAVLIATQGSLAVSINSLAAADGCVCTMPEWNPDANLQLESRLHRMGATAQEIVIYYLLARGTLDDRILSLMEDKAREAAEIDNEDRAGLNLVADLEGGAFKDGSLSLEEICRIGDEMEELLNSEVSGPVEG